MKRPHRFDITITPAFTPPLKYSFEHGSLSVRAGFHEHRTAIPTIAQWSGFWRLCQFLDLWSWQPRYDTGDITRDGQSWELGIAFDKQKQIKSSGDNSYPSLESVQIARPTMDRFGLLLHFIDISLVSPRYDMRDDYADS